MTRGWLALFADGDREEVEPNELVVTTTSESRFNAKEPLVTACDLVGSQRTLKLVDNTLPWDTSAPNSSRKIVTPGRSQVCEVVSILPERFVPAERKFMCGIAGLFQRNGRGLRRELLREFAGNMANVIAHRGPDGSGVWVDEGARCALSHRRLSIIDTSNAASQPFHSGDRRWQLTFNGEIYNYRDIRAKLERQGCRFRSRSDTEVLIEALAMWGPEVIRELDGMFAFAAFDTLTGKLILARDPFGEKPLYYSWLDGATLAFASELRSQRRLIVSIG
jgi:hypothetical protein